MITITHRLAHQLRTVLRRAFGNFRSNSPAIGFIASAEGLTVRSIFGDVAVECRLPGTHTAETAWLPFEFLADVAGKNDEAVDLEAGSDGQVSVQWRTGNVPQIVKYNAKEPLADKLPVPPTAFTTNPPGLLQALHEASEVANREGVRYATHCLQLCPDGSINATDGRQLLIQSGFDFPWQDTVLVPGNKVFTAAELPRDQQVAVAQSGDWVAVRAGRWTVYLRINECKYPNVPRIVPDPAAAKARCQLSKDDIRFLAETLPQLPGNDADDRPVTIDLNGHVAIRAKAGERGEAHRSRADELALDGRTDPRCRQPHVLAAGDAARPPRPVTLRQGIGSALPKLRPQVRLDASGCRGSG